MQSNALGVTSPRTTMRHDSSARTGVDRGTLWSNQYRRFGLLRPACVLVVGLLSLSLAQQVSAITISAAKAMPVGTEVTIENAVVSNLIDTVFSGSVQSFQIQDTTGGITVTDGQPIALAAGLSVGDEISITGPVGAFNGLAQLGFGITDITVTGSPGAPVPTEITPLDLADFSPTAEGLESTLVRLSGVEFTGITPGDTFAGGTNYTVSDGTDTAIARLSGDSVNPHPLIGLPIPTGLVPVTGIFSQFDSSNPPAGQAGVGYQVLILAVPEPTTLGLLVVGGLLLASRRRD